MDVILFSIKLNEICVKLKTNGLKDDFEILEYFSGEDFFAVFRIFSLKGGIGIPHEQRRPLSSACQVEMPCRGERLWMRARDRV